MATLQEVRQRFPQYNDIPDGELADRLYQRYYSDLPRPEFDKQIGFYSSDESAPVAPPIAADAGNIPYQQQPAFLEANAVPEGGPKPLSDARVGPGLLALSPRGLQLGTQAAGKGLADIAGLPGDLSTGVTNLALYGLDKLSPLDVPYRFPPSPVGSEAISSAVGDAAQNITGVAPLEQDDLGPLERGTYNAVRFGTGAVTGGTGLARKALGETANVARAPRVSDAFTRPYREAPKEALVNDAAAGVGAGTALTASQDLLPDSVQGPLTDLLAMLVGGFTGATAAGGASIPARTARAVERSLPDPNIPVNVSKGELPVSRRTADQAATFLQERSADPAKAAERIGQVTNEARLQGEPVPTTGIASGDIGLVASERGARLKDPVPFQQSDQALRDAAQERVTGLSDEGANPMLARAEIERQTAEQRAAAQKSVDEATGALEGTQAAQKMQGDRLKAERGTGEAASEKLDSNVRGTMEAETKVKNEKFRNIDPDGTVVLDAEPLADLVKGVRDSVPRTVPESEVLPEAYLRRFSQIAKGKETDTGLVDEAGQAIIRKEDATVTFKELNDARPFLASAITKAEQAGDYSLARNLRALKSYTDDVAEQLAAQGSEAGKRAGDAIENFKVRFAPRFREGEGGKFAADVRGDKLGTRTRPTDTARRFLSSKEAAQDFARIMEVSATPEEGFKAARQWFLDRMAGVVGSDNKISAERLRVFRDKNKGVLDQVPGLRKEVDDMLTSTINGAEKENALAQQLKAAQTKQKLTEQEIQKSAAAILLDEDPVKAAAKALSAGRYEAPRKVAEITNRLRGNKEALRGWKQAITEHLIEKVTNTNTALTGGPEGPVSVAKLQKTFKQMGEALAEVYTPAEMNSLRRAHKMLEPLGNLSRQVTAGSPTIENDMLWNSLEAGLLGVTGNAITTGMVMKRIRVALKFLPNPEEKLAFLVGRTWFDPDLAQHLLTREVKKVQRPEWNSKLLKLLAAGEASRDGEK